jgi:hypothetical protein
MSFRNTTGVSVELMVIGCRMKRRAAQQRILCRTDRTGLGITTVGWNDLLGKLRKKIIPIGSAYLPENDARRAVC